MSLNEHLEQMRQASWGRWPKEKLDVVLRARDELARSGIVDRILQVGDQSYELPLPATYVIDRGGMIRAVFADADYVKRMEPADILAALRVLQT